MGKTISGPITFRQLIDQVELATKKYLAEQGNVYGFYGTYTTPLQPDAITTPWTVQHFEEHRLALSQDPLLGLVVQNLYSRGLFDEYCARDDAAATIEGRIQDRGLIQTHIINITAMTDTAEGISLPDHSNQQYTAFNYNELDHPITLWVRTRDAALETLETRARANYQRDRRQP